MKITTQLTCNPAECKEATTKSFGDNIVMYVQDTNRSIDPNHTVTDIDDIIIACRGLTYPEITAVGRNNEREQSLIALCTAEVIEASVTIRKVE